MTETSNGTAGGASVELMTSAGPTAQSLSRLGGWISEQPDCLLNGGRAVEQVAQALETLPRELAETAPRIGVGAGEVNAWLAQLNEAARVASDENSPERFAAAASLATALEAAAFCLTADDPALKEAAARGALLPGP